jgi:hypothetical protein
MGLTASIGFLESVRDDPAGQAWFRRSLAGVNEVLRTEGLPEHVEPTELPPHTYRSELDSIGWDWLHCLRRLHALVLHGVEPTPAPENYPGREPDPVIDEELSVHMRSHLIVHSYAEGWYVPIDFRDMLYGDVPGRILGSSPRLLAELTSLAEPLDIPLASGGLDDAAAQRLNAVTDADPWWREKYAWLHLFEAARLSVDLGTAIVFH